jgi:uncharacterized membrane protein
MQEKRWHELFEIGIVIKAVNGVWETIVGTTFLFISKNAINRLLLHLSRGELLEDPHGRLINFIAYSLSHLSTNVKIFAAAYILAHGILNIFLAYELYRERLWAYPAAIVFILLFMSYQIHRIARTHSLVLAVITIFDALFVIVAWHEYQYKKRLPR